MTDIEHVADVVLDDGLDDWVLIDTLIWCARETAKAPDRDYKKLALDTLTFLLREELAEVGDLGESGFEAWTTPLPETIDRVTKGLDAVNWQPEGGFCWISITSKGEQRIKQQD